MDSSDPRLTPGDFGDIDMRDSEPVPGEERRPSPPVPELGRGPHAGATPQVPVTTGGAGGGLTGDLRSRSDGEEISSPEGQQVDEALLENEHRTPPGELEDPNLDD